MRLLLTAASLAALTTPVAAQWLNHPTPGIPRTADSKPNSRPRHHALTTANLTSLVCGTALCNPSWMGYSVGRWEGETLVVDSFGFNDRTWLNDRGLPHTEALRMTERYQRPDFGHLRIDVTFTDPSTYTKPLNLVVNMKLAADTEMLEAVCETSSDQWATPSEPTPAVHEKGGEGGRAGV